MTNHPNRNWKTKLRREAESLGPDLVSAFVALHNNSPTAAGAEIGYSANRVCAWRRGSEPTPKRVQKFMRQCVLSHVGCAVLAEILEPPA